MGFYEKWDFLYFLYFIEKKARHMGRHMGGPKWIQNSFDIRTFEHSSITRTWGGCGRADAPMFECPNVKCPNVRMSECPNVECPNVQIIFVLFVESP